MTRTEELAETEDVNPVTFIDDVSTFVDPDAFSRLFRIRLNGEYRDLAGCLELQIHGADVTVHADGKIDIRV